MRIAKQDVPVKIAAPGAVARQMPDFGDAQGYGMFGAEYFSLDAGTDLSPLLQGLEGDLCQSPHWGYLIKGQINVKYADGQQERVTTSDLFYWPPGHTIIVEEDAELVLFSPQHQHTQVLEHLRAKLGS